MIAAASGCRRSLARGTMPRTRTPRPITYRDRQDRVWYVSESRASRWSRPRSTGRTSASSSGSSGKARSASRAGSAARTGATARRAAPPVRRGGVGGLRNSRCRATARRDGGLSGLGASVQILVSQPGIQNALCSKLSTAAAAEACGDTSAQNGILRAFRQQVEAQTGNAITETDVALLIAASESLMAD